MAASMALVVSLSLGQAPPASPTAAPAPPAGPAPHIKFESTVLNLGDVVRGQDAVAEFVYTNSGDAALKILSAKPG
jgi:hypothetical protein